MRKAVIFVCVVTSLLITAGLPLQSQSAHGQDDATINLSITCKCSDHDVIWLNDFVIPAFTEQMTENDKVVNVEVLNLEFSDEEMREQLALDFSLEQGADIVTFDGFWVPEFAESGLIKPLNEIVPSSSEWEGWDHISPGVQQVLMYHNDLYGIARGTDARVIWYRTDLFEDAGIEVPWQPTSWQELIDTAEILQEAGIESPLQINASTTMGEATTMQGYFMLLLGAGHHMYDFEENKWIASSPNMLATLDMYQTIYAEGLANTELQLLDDARDASFDAFRNGEIAMYVEGDWFYRSPLSADNFENHDQMSWALMPAIEPGAGYLGQDYVTISGGTGWILNPSTEHPEEAWALLSFLASQEATQDFFSLEARIPFRDDVETTDEILTDIAANALSYTTVRPLLPEYPLVSYESQLMVERVISGEMTPTEAMQAYDDAITEIVGEDNIIRIPLSE